ncbi:GlsB/YeaQ/YmgE family stress response membrane protein [Loigolactobacillus binensis]|uniref:GlsB/YeaQ/YmgE family stress response membrane protein n=1 Tax=Loigolactobacillus binensis TaxID=2559922 RepID=A0ABW3EGT4_9LACO|nr:GlsB/YeaQ/YmgE family stress response membrane protein [Loigolactobacillus binensis]
MFHLIWLLLTGALIGGLAGAITSRKVPLGWLGLIVAGLIGAWLGETLFGSWGPQVADLALLPAIGGAIILVLIVAWAFSHGPHQ